MDFTEEYMNQFNQLLLLLMGLCLLMGCQTTKSDSQHSYAMNTALYNDDAFQHYQQFPIETEQDVFDIDEVMQAMVEKELLPERNIKRRARKLLRHLFAKENIALAYQSTANLTAVDAYHNQKANCMSLTIMAYSLAKAAKLDVKFQDVLIPEYWVRNGEYNMLTGHVNLVVTQPRDVSKMVVFGNDIIEIDFDPYVIKKSFAKDIVSKSTVLAMFYNNKGAQALVKHKYDLAYAYFKQATLVAPGFSSAWGNLGILYKMTGNYTLAEDSYRYAVTINSGNLTALTNLSLLLKEQGQLTEVAKIESQLHKKRINNPYYHALLADEAFFNGNNQLALKYYKKALKLNDTVHEFYFGLAKVHYQLNDVKRAKNAMKKAISLNKVNSTEQKYIAKLNFLKQGGLPH